MSILPRIYSPREECGIFGVYGHPEAANLTYLGLYALQHRGQEGVGICSSDGNTLYIEKSMGLVSEAFNEKRLKSLPGHIAIGHNRYSTAGGSSIKNVQPLQVNFSQGSMALAHNGNITNADILKESLEYNGAIFQSNADSEVIIHLIAHTKGESFRQKVIMAARTIKGAFSLLIMRENELIAMRDPYGVRPLSLAEYNDGYVVASETCAFDLIGATYIRDIEPGELVTINDKGVHCIKALTCERKAHCVFELIYFARPDSNVFNGVNVNKIRKELGRQLARESAIDADIVIPVPDSGVPSTLGFAQVSDIPFEVGLIRNHYIGRTFIEPRQSIRHFGVKIKLNPIKQVLKGKRVIVVDDSIVRGTTSKKIVKMIREVGEAKEVHLRISSPTTISPCFYGIDTPTRQELIAASHMVDEIKRYVTADSLSYLSIEGLQSVLSNPQDYCYACFNKEYPIVLSREPQEPVEQMELFLV